MLFNDEFLEGKLLEQQNKGNYRQLSQNLLGIDFFSNDYLGFAKNNRIMQYSNKIKNQYNIKQYGATGSRLISGNHFFIEKVEHEIAQYHKAKAGLIYNSGFDANIGIFSSIPQKGDLIIYDEQIHVSVKMGMRLSFAEKIMFKHNNIQDLEKKLQKDTRGNKIVAVETIYSISGDMAPIIEIVNLCKKYKAYIIVDEAHSSGVFGNRGVGMIADLGLENEIFIRLHTFGKAMGTSGGIVLTTENIRNYLINFSSSFIYSTAMPIMNYVAIKAAYTLLEESPEKIIKINNNIQYFNNIAKKYNIITNINNSPVKNIHTASNKLSDEIQNNLYNEGFIVKSIKSPTVKTGNECVRIIIHAFNNKNQIKNLIKKIATMKKI